MTIPAATQTEAPAPAAPPPAAPPAAAARVEAALDAVRVAAAAVGGAVEDELKAVRGFSHLHDLIKIASLSECKIEMDGLRLRVEAAKERESLLRFSLSAAEKSADASTLERLAGSKQGRASTVDQRLNKQLKDLEQRARRDTSGISVARLNEMLPAAKQKQLDAAARRAAVVDALLDAAGVSKPAPPSPRSTKQLLKESEPLLQAAAA